MCVVGFFFRGSDEEIVCIRKIRDNSMCETCASACDVALVKVAIVKCLHKIHN